MGFSTIFINTTSIALLAFVIAYSCLQRRQTAAPQLMITAFFMLVWAAGTFAEILSVSAQGKILWRNITQIGVFYTPSPACCSYWHIPRDLCA